MTTAAPYFSIVMPVFNRRVTVCRAIESCLAQDFPSFEVLVVDDGSDDGTGEAVASYSGRRVRLIRHQTNRGVCPSRNSAVRASRGEWLIFLDSDHEMLPGGLSQIRQYLAADDSPCRWGFQYLFDDGRVSPSPMPAEPVVGYLEWLRWIDRAIWTDALWVTRRRCFDHCWLPESFALEFSYFLDFAKRFASRMVPVVLAFQHTDSPDRLSYMTPPGDPGLAKRKSQDQAADWRHVLAEHGEALRAFAPRRYQAVLRNAAFAKLMSGDQDGAIQNSIAGIRFRPASLYAWITLAIVLAGPRAALLVNRIRSRRLRRSVGELSTPAIAADLSQLPIKT